MTFRLHTCLPLLAAVTCAPSKALAHTGQGEASGFIHGLAHPVFGMDHVITMVMIGIFAYQLAGRAICAVPATFLMAMTFGGLLGILGVAMPFFETGIFVSVPSLVAIVALRVRMPVAVASAVSGFFSIFHGYAHGAEMPHNTSAFGYAAGFLAATAFLHVAGLGLAFAWHSTMGALIRRHALKIYQSAN